MKILFQILFCIGFIAMLFGATGMDSEQTTIPMALVVFGGIAMFIGGKVMERYEFDGE